jgi:ribonuclease HI
MDYCVYTDGACSNNGKTNARAGIGIFFGIDDPRNISQKVEGKQTNNIAELTAILKVYPIIESDINNCKNVIIFTDSEYAIKCVTTYGEKCCNKGWLQDIPNKELVRKTYETYKNHPNIQIQYVKAHTNNQDLHSIGNFYADKLANEAIEKDLDELPYAEPKRIYLIVPFTKKDSVKQFGGKWDSTMKKWYIYDNNEHIQEILSEFKNPL